MLAFVATDAAISPAALQTLVSALHPLDLQRGDGGRRPLDQRHLPAVRHRPGRRAADQPRRRPAAGRLPRQAGGACCSTSPSSWSATARARPSSSRSPSPAPRADASARKIARTIAESPLVKTAFAGEDANWGRIVMAVGRADEPVNRDRMSVTLRRPGRRPGRRGLARPTTRRKMSAYMKKPELEVTVDVGVGRGSAGDLDLRPDQALRRDQRRLPQLSGRMTVSCSSPPRPWSTSTAGC